MGRENYQNLQYNSMLQEVSDFFENVYKNNKGIDISKLQQINFWINKAKNCAFLEKCIDLLSKFDYEIDFNDLNRNFEQNFNFNDNNDLSFQNINDNRNNILYILSNFNIVNIKNYKDSFLSFLNKLFDSSKSFGEKKQIFEIIKIYNPKQCDDVKYKDFHDIPYNNLNISKKQKILEIKTNGFFSIEKTNAKKRKILKIKNNLLNVFNQLQVGNIDDIGLKKDQLNEICEGFTEKYNYEEIRNNIYNLFNIDFNENDPKYIENMQLKKIKIFLLQKLFNSFSKKDNDWLKMAKIQKILSLEKKDFDIYKFDLFSNSCILVNEYNQSDEFDFDNLITLSDILYCQENISCEIKKDTIDNIFNNHILYDKISFVEVKDNKCSDEVYYEEQIGDSQEKIYIIYCNASQKRNIISKLFSNHNVCNKVVDVKSKFSLCKDIIDFAKIINQTKNNPLSTENYLDIYRKLFSVVENNGVGGLKNDKTFSISKDSHENFIRNDFSKYTISSDILFEILKIQTFTNNPITEIKFNISDIENLPKLLGEYYNFVLQQRDNNCNVNLTTPLKMTIKTTNYLTENELFKLYNYLNSNLFRICFKELRIDSKEFYDFLKKYNLRITSQYVICGYNDIFSDEENVNKRNNQLLGNIFNKNKAKKIITEYTQPNKDENSKMVEFNDIVLDYNKTIQNNLNKLMNHNDTDISFSTETSTNTDIDVDLQMIIELNKKPEEIKGFDDKDAITEDNISSRMADLLSSQNKRFSDNTKKFLFNFQKDANVSWTEIFNKVTNRNKLQHQFNNIDKKGFNYRFTPEAFVSMIYDFLKIGFARFNGTFGNPELEIQFYKDSKGKDVYIVGQNNKKIEEKIKEPIFLMYSAIQHETVENDNNKLIYNNDQKSLLEYEKIGKLIKNPSYIHSVFYGNIKKLSLECQSYVGSHFDEIKAFIEKINKNTNYFNICNNICSVLCSGNNLGNVKRNFSSVDPVKLLRGVNQVFQLLDNLKKEHFIDDANIKMLANYLDSDNPYLIQKVYIVLLKRKIKIAKTIIIDRIQNHNENISIDINNDSEVLQYISKHPLSEEETEYSRFDFHTLFFSKKYSNILDIFDDTIDSGSTINDVIHFGQSASIYASNNSNGIENLFKIVPNGNNLECFLHNLNCKYNRLQDGTINDPRLNDAQKSLVYKKVDIIKMFIRLNDNLSKIKDQKSDEYNYACNKIQLFVDVLLNCWQNENQNGVDIDNFLDIFINIDDIKIKQLINNIGQEKFKENFIFIYPFLQVYNVDDCTAYIEAFDVFLKKKSLILNDKEMEEYRKVYLIILSMLKKKERQQFITDLTTANSFDIHKYYRIDNESINKNNICYLIAKYNGNNTINFASVLDVDFFIQKSIDEIFIESENKTKDNFEKLKDLLDVILLHQLKINNSNKREEMRDKLYNIFFNNHGKIMNGSKDALKDIIDSLKVLDRNTVINVINYVDLLKTKHRYTPKYIKYFIKSFICVNKTANLLNLNLDINSFYFFVIKTDKDFLKKFNSKNFSDIKDIVKFICCDIIEMSQKLQIIEKYNFKGGFNKIKIINCLNDYYREDLSLKLSKYSIHQLIGKFVNERDDYILDSNQHINSIIGFMLKLNELYVEALKNNNISAKNKFLQIFEKIELIISNYSLSDINRVISQINNNIDKNDDIVYYIDYLLQHPEATYKDLSILYSIDKNEKYLNLQFNHREIIKMAKKNKEDKNVKDGFIKNLNDFIDNKKTQLTNEDKTGKSSRVITKIYNATKNIKDIFVNFSNKQFKNKSNVNVLLKKLNKDYNCKNFLSPEQLCRIENINLLEQIFKNGNISENIQDNNIIEGIKEQISYVLSLSTELLQDTNMASQLFNRILYKKNSGEELKNDDKLNLIASFFALFGKEQNKMFRPEQLAAVILQTYVSQEYNNVIVKLPTGAGKTLTLLNNIFYCGFVNKYTPITLTTNSLLVKEMFLEAKKISLFRGHIYRLNEKQELIDEQNNVVPVSKIKEILKDSRNMIFSTPSNFDFWRKKLLLNGGNNGCDIVKYIFENAQINIDEIDTLVDTKTTNKVSISSNQNMVLKYKILNNFKQYDTEIMDLIKDNDLPSLRKMLYYIYHLSTGDETFNDKEYSFTIELLSAYIDAKKMESGVDYTVENLGDTSVIYPIKQGSVDKSGAKYNSNIDLALKLKLQDEGYIFKNLLQSTDVINESINFDVFRYAKRTFGVSGTILGANDIWGNYGFTTINIQPANPKLLKTSYQRGELCSLEHEGKNPLLDLVLLAYSWRYKKLKQSDLSAFIREIIPKEIANKLHEKNDIDVFGDNFTKKLLHIFNYKDNCMYNIITLSDGQQLKKVTERLKENQKKLCNLLNIQNEHNIISLNSQNEVIDDKTLKDKLSNGVNYMVFTLQDRARGFDFPKGSRVISVDINNTELDEQIHGRTARNGQFGELVYAYQLTEKDINILNCNSNTVNHINDDDVYPLMNDVNKIKKIKSNLIVEDFKNKYKTLTLEGKIGDKILLFLNLITSQYDKKKKNEVYEKSYPYIINFQQKLTDYLNQQDNNYNNNNIESSMVKLLRELYDRFYVVNKIDEEHKFSFDFFFKKLNTMTNLIRRDNVKQIVNKREFNPSDLSIKNRNNLTNKITYVTINIKDIEKNEDRYTNVKNITINTELNNYLFLIGALQNCDFKKIKTYSTTSKLNKDEYQILLESTEAINPLNYYLNRGVTVAKKEFFDHDDYGKLITKEKKIIILDKKVSEKEKKEIINKNAHNDDCLILSMLDNRNIECINNGDKYDLEDDKQIQYLNYLIKEFSGNNSAIVDKKTAMDRVKSANNNKIADISKVNNSYDEKKELNDFFIQNEQEKIKKALINNGIQTIFNNSLVSDSFEELNDKNKLDLSNSSAVDFNNRINSLKTISLELNEMQQNNILKGDSTLSDVICDIIKNYLKELEILKENINDDDFLDYEEKQQMLSNVDYLMSEKNLEKQAIRIMEVISSIMMCESVQETHIENNGLDNIDMFINGNINIEKNENWNKDINFDNLDDVRNKLQSIVESSQKQEEFSYIMKNKCFDDEKKLKETIYKQYNNVQSNLNIIDANINEMQFYKDYIESLDNSSIKFHSFEDKEYLNALKSDFVTKKDYYNKALERLEGSDNGYLSSTQKNYVLEKIVNANIDNTIKNIFNKDNLKFFFNELSVVSYDKRDASKNPLFDFDQDTNVSDKFILYHHILEDIKDLYNEVYGDFVNLYTYGEDQKNKKIDENEQKNEQQKYNYFIRQVKNIIQKYQTDLCGEKDKKSYKTLTMEVYDLFGHLLSGLDRNYNKNKKKKESLIQKIKENIIDVAEFFNENKEVHTKFENDLLQTYKYFGIVKDKNKYFDNGFLLSEKGISGAINELYSLDIEKLEQFSDIIEMAKIQDITNAKRRVNEIINEKNEISSFVKYLLVFITFGLILLTDEGRRMFDKEEKPINNDMPNNQNINNQQLNNHNNI